MKKFGARFSFSDFHGQIFSRQQEPGLREKITENMISNLKLFRTKVHIRLRVSSYHRLRVSSYQVSELEEGYVFCMTCKAVSLRPTHTDCHINTACES